jgi:ribonuclease G
MTRQNLTLGLREIMTEVCPTCGGEGRVLSEESVILMVERRLIRLARESATPGLRVAVHPRMAALLQSGEPSRVRRVESESGRFLILCPAEDAAALDHVALVPD